MPDTLPKSVSPEARAVLERLMPYLLERRTQLAASRPRTPEQFSRTAAERETAMMPMSEAIVQKLGVSVTARRLGSIAALEVVPPNHVDDGSTLVYVHGGAFVLLSARSTLGAAALLAASSGRRVVSLDYTLAPAANWKRISDEVCGALGALTAEGRDPRSVGIVGESAGAAIVSGALLRLQSEGAAPPGALALICAVTDLEMQGDSHLTLAEWDPMMTADALRMGYDAYATPSEQRLPRVSPARAKFGAEWPPTLFIAGTREILLSDSVLMHRAIRDAGGESRLELFDAMPHSFLGAMSDAPEGRAAFAELARHWSTNLRA